MSVMEKIIYQTLDQDNKSTLLKTSCFLGYFFAGLTTLIGLLLVIISGAPSFLRIFPELKLFFIVAGGKITMSFAFMFLALAMVSFFGVVQIWHQLKIGFWVFAVPMLLIISLPFLMIDMHKGEILFFTQPLLAISISLIVLFGLNYKKMY